MTTRKNTADHFRDGYQQALKDIALKLATGGSAGVQEWLVANLTDDQYREIAQRGELAR